MENKMTDLLDYKSAQLHNDKLQRSLTDINNLVKTLAQGGVIVNLWLIDDTKTEAETKFKQIKAELAVPVRKNK
jgi:hypothetical protein